MCILTIFFLLDSLLVSFCRFPQIIQLLVQNDGVLSRQFGGSSNDCQDGFESIGKGLELSLASASTLVHHATYICQRLALLAKDRPLDSLPADPFNKIPEVCGVFELPKAESYWLWSCSLPQPSMHRIGAPHRHSFLRLSLGLYCLLSCLIVVPCESSSSSSTPHRDLESLCGQVGAWYSEKLECW